MYRVEDKYIPSNIDFAVLKRRMQGVLPLDSSSNTNTGYRISSLYFDDLYDTHLKDTIEGNPIRKKYRIRIYNNTLQCIKLEVKYKCYNRIKKNSVSISREQMLSLVCGEPIEFPFMRDDPRTEFCMAIKQQCLRPKVIVTYKRMAFIHDAGNVRITFDENIGGSLDVESFGCSDLLYHYPKDFNAVLEVKYDEFLPRFIAQTLEIDSMWQTSFSKYRICREIF